MMVADRKRKEAIRDKADPKKVVITISKQSRKLHSAIKELETDRLLKQARWMSIPLPQDDDDTMWEYAETEARWYLTDKGQFTLRALIRSERKERLEGWRAWLPAIASAISAAAAWIIAFRK